MEATVAEYPAEGKASHPSEYQPQRLPNSAPRFLCVCEGGNCRSVSMAMLMKSTLTQDAIACSWKDISPETLDMLCEWADSIFVAEAYMADKIPEKHRGIVNVIEIGPDVWCNPFHSDLVGKICNLFSEEQVIRRRIRAPRQD